MGLNRCGKPGNHSIGFNQLHQRYHAERLWCWHAHRLLQLAADGTILGQFSNNQTQALGQVAVASFANDQGLQQSSNGDYQATTASGAAVIGQANAGGNGTIEGDSVEESNVSLSTEFANMIVAQQGYQANAKALTTMNQVEQATMQMIT